jgi:serine/threonine protein phosphatase PrpC
VFDGHGIDGEKVSGQIKKDIVRCVEEEASRAFKNRRDRMGSESPSLAQSCGEPNIPQHEKDVFSRVQNKVKNKIIKMAFRSANLNLRNQLFDTRLSGTTANTIILSEKILTSCNVGDSRCIMGTLDQKGLNEWKRRSETEEHPQFDETERKMYWRCIALSKDHKPNAEAEKARILKAGGRVSAIYDPISGAQIGPHRVWLKDIDIPGLAMSRSLGDDIVRPVGVIGDPEIREIELEE